MLTNWLVPVLAVGVLGAVTLAFALLIGRWIDAQSNSVVDEPRAERVKRRAGGKKKQGEP
jgi:hypothetical protein